MEHQYNLRKRKAPTNVNEERGCKRRKITQDSETRQEPTYELTKENLLDRETGANGEDELDNRSFTPESSEDESDEPSEVTLESSDESEHSEEYFELETEPICNVLDGIIKRKFPSIKITKPELRTIIKEASKKAGKDIGEEYCGVEPKDSSWKLDPSIDPTEVEMLSTNLKDLRLEIKKDKITLPKILKSMIPKDNKKKAIQLFDILKNTEPYTEEYFDTENRIRTIIGVTYGTEEELKFVEEEFTRLKSNMGERDERLRDKILRLNTSDDKKIALLDMYSRMSSMQPTDSEYHTIQNKLIWATNLPYDTRTNSYNTPKNMIEIREYCQNVYSALNNELYGMEPVKQRVVQIINNRMYNPKTNAIVAMKGQPGVGKCLGKNTPVMMFNGSVKYVQNINVGDLLMGDDSTPRLVQSVCTGRENLFKVKQGYGADYIVNQSHILSLRENDNSEPLDMPVGEFIENGKYNGYKVAVEYSEQELPISPYLLGLWLGVRTSCNPQNIMVDNTIMKEVFETYPDIRLIRNEEKEIISYYELCYELNKTLDFYRNVDNSYALSETYIPENYKFNSRENRLQLLAGILDSGGMITNEGYEFHTPFMNMTRELDKVVKSLGIKINYKLSDDCLGVFRLNIGSLKDIPVRTKYFLEHSELIPDFSLTYPITLEPLGEGDYYGFEIDGNRRFLLGDFTVTHNTAIAKATAKASGLPFSRIALGGMTDPGVFKGSQGVWVGADPSEFLKILRRTGVKDGIVLLDEIDKLLDDPKGGVILSSFLEVLDKLQNKDFRDMYINEFDHDLSELWIWVAMNDDRNLPSPLKDRMDIIEIKKYTTKEMIEIIKRHILPNVLVNIGFMKNDISITDSAAGHVISLLQNDISETGLRPVEKHLHQLISKLNMIRTFGNSEEIEKTGIKLDYSIDEFKGLPFEITIKTVEKLSVKKDLPSWNMMYM